MYFLQICVSNPSFVCIFQSLIFYILHFLDIFQQIHFLDIFQSLIYFSKILLFMKNGRFILCLVQDEINDLLVPNINTRFLVAKIEWKQSSPRENCILLVNSGFVFDLTILNSTIFFQKINILKKYL